MKITQEFSIAYRDDCLFPATKLIDPVMFKRLSARKVSKILSLRGFPIHWINKRRYVIPSEAGAFVKANMGTVRSIVPATSIYG